ncbi:hypothetical protein [uncultured Cytophaga sp.]|uniref:hypothetical protein n=1 Tax=uncultured Cytophaga sp. TaxID=160238 RepID=UPI0026269EF1|nr:hypothetical protein [uncultured Cytophaga sp.]
MKPAKFSILTIASLLIYACETKTEVRNTPVQDTLIATSSTPINFLKSPNKKDILQAFLKPMKIVHDTAYWEEDLESLDMLVSNDGYIHTVVDSIYEMDENYIVVFKTHLTMEDGELASGHPSYIDYSIGSFEKNKDSEGYSITRLKKHLTSGGSFGYGQSGEIIDFKKDLKAISIPGGWVGMGTVMSYEDYFNIQDFSHLLRIETYNSNEGICEDEDINCINKTERDIIPFENHPSKKPAIIIHYKHTYFDNEQIIIEKTDTLIYDGYHFNKDIYYKGV